MGFFLHVRVESEKTQKRDWTLKTNGDIQRREYKCIKGKKICHIISCLGNCKPFGMLATVIYIKYEDGR